MLTQDRIFLFSIKQQHCLFNLQRKVATDSLGLVLHFYNTLKCCSILAIRTEQSALITYTEEKDSREQALETAFIYLPTLCIWHRG